MVCFKLKKNKMPNSDKITKDTRNKNKYNKSQTTVARLNS